MANAGCAVLDNALEPQTQVNELETHRARQEPLQLLVTAQAYERKARHVVALAKLLGPEPTHALRAKP